MAMSQLGLFPGGGTAIGLPLGPLLIALAVNFVLGALVMLGIGNYGPCLILFSLLGMDPRAAFPVMMSSASMVAMIGGLRFMTAGRYDLRAALGLRAAASAGRCGRARQVDAARARSDGWSCAWSSTRPS